jgi:hypothetical protein
LSPAARFTARKQWSPLIGETCQSLAFFETPKCAQLGLKFTLSMQSFDGIRWREASAFIFHSQKCIKMHEKDEYCYFLCGIRTLNN